MDLYDIPFRRMDGTTTSLAEHRDDVVLVVNVASRCGLAPQYATLETMHEKYADRGFTVLGFPCIGLNGGPAFKQSEAFSFQVHTETQEETDRLWNAIVGNGGAESMCGWCKDKWGVSWQITPRALTDATMGSDPAAAKRAFDAMMTMKKIDIAAIEAAVRGEAVDPA